MKPAATIALTFAIVFGGCTRSAKDEAPAKPDDSLAVSVAEVTRMPIESRLRLLGTTVALHRVTVRAPAAGRVSGLKLNAGDVVSKGDVVAHVTTKEDEAVRLGLALERNLDPENAALTNGAVRRRLDSAGIAVHAPESGVVSQRFVSDGQQVADLDQIIELVDPAAVYVEAAVPITALETIKPGMAATVTSPLRPGEEFPARVAAISPSFSQSGTTSPLRLEFATDRRIQQVGAATEARVTTASSANAIVVPAAAVFQDAERGTYYAFVAGPDGRAHRVSVDVGIHNSGQIEIKSGLTAGQRVITSGGYALSDGLKIRPTGSGS